MDILFSIKKLVGLFVAPLPIIALGLIAANFLLWLQKAQASVKWVLGVTTLAYLAFSSPWLSNALLQTLEETYPVYQDSHENVDNIVVLGCWHREDAYRPLVDNVHPCSLVRLVEAARLAKRYPEARIVLSGFDAMPSRDHQYSHPAYNARLLKAIGIAPERIKTVAGSRDTRDEARKLQPVIQGQTNLLVSSASHLRRAVALFNQRNISITPVPARYLSGHDNKLELHSFIPSSDSLRRSETALYELMGNLWVRLHTPDKDSN